MAKYSKYMSKAINKARADVKRLNQRLRELEKQGLENASPWYNSLKKALHDNVTYVTTDSKGRVKFRTDIATLYASNPRSFYALERKVQRSYESKSTTYTEFKESWLKGFEQFKRDNPTIDISIDDYSTMLDDDRTSRAIKKYGYSEFMDLMQEATDNDIDEGTALQYMLEASDIDVFKKMIQPNDEDKKRVNNITDWDSVGKW